MYAADKAASGTAPTSTVLAILRKATTRRVSTQYSVPDLVSMPSRRHLFLIPPLSHPTLPRPSHSHPRLGPLHSTRVRVRAPSKTDAATEFQNASRPDLADKEHQEAAILAAFLPPLLPEAEIDRVLQAVIASPEIADAISKGAPPQRALGQVFKAFYAHVDKANVDSELVRRRAQALLAPSS